MIEIKEATKYYSKGTIIGPINLQIPKGGITAIIGPNGAGKSTLLSMIGRLQAIDSGKILVDSLDVSKAPSNELAQILAILKQENHLMTRLTVRQLVSFGRFPYSKGRLNSNDHEIINQYIEFFDLSELEHHFLDELSGGQRQRAYVAMAMAQETPYILLDEPLNNLDIARSVSIMQHLRSACNQMKRTIIIILHDINFAARYADQICVMKAGQVVHLGSVDEVIREDILSEVFETKISIVETDQGKIAVY